MDRMLERGIAAFGAILILAAISGAISLVVWTIRWWRARQTGTSASLSDPVAATGEPCVSTEDIAQPARQGILRSARSRVSTRLLGWPQLVVLWGIGLIVSGLLFQFGLRRHMVREANLRGAIAITAGGQVERLHKIDEAQEDGESYPDQLNSLIATYECLGDELEELEQKRLEAEDRQNPYIGIVAPLVILGACAFVSALRQHRRPNG